MLDPSFRTIDGFQRLVIKEWLSFGHQFGLRCGMVAPLERGTHLPSDEECAPIFLQYIDCVWQLMQQMPHAFEFNSRYLATLLHHMLSSEHGTFLCNSERQVTDRDVPTDLPLHIAHRMTLCTCITHQSPPIAFVAHLSASSMDSTRARLRHGVSSPRTPTSSSTHTTPTTPPSSRQICRLPHYAHGLRITAVGLTYF